MTTTNLELTAHQADILTALRALTEQLGWQGEALVIEHELVYQLPLPNDPDISGAFWIVEASEPIVRLYLMLPLNAAPAQISEAALFQARVGHGRRFGALELDVDDGSLRVRMEADATEEELEATLTSLLDRALALARVVSPGWRALTREDVSVDEALRRCASE